MSELDLGIPQDNHLLLAEQAQDRVGKRLVQDRKPSNAHASEGSWVNWGAERDFLGQPWDVTKIPLSKLEQMRRDPILAFALMFVKVPLVRAPWYIKCSDPKIAAAVDASLRRVYGRFILAYTNSFDYGFSPMVKRFQYEDRPDWTYVDKDDVLADEQPVWTSTAKPIVWKPFTALNPRLSSPHWNSKGEFNGIDFAQKGLSSPFFTSGYPMNAGGKYNQKRLPDIALDWALWATNEKDSVFGNYYGYPRIGYAYRFWWAYWYRFGVSDRAFEKWGDPPVLVYHPDDTTAFDRDGNPIDYTADALHFAEKLRSGANAAMPSGVVDTMDGRSSSIRQWEAKQMEVNTDFSSINQTFEYLDVQKIRSVLVPEQALVEGKGGTSSRNVASTFGDLFQESQAVVKQEIDDHLNRFVIPQFVQINFGDDAPRAEIVTTGFDPADMETMQEVVRLIGQRKLLTMVNDRELLERLGIPTVSNREMNRRQAEVAVEVEEESVPEPRLSQSGTDEAAGVTEDGKYYAPRERITLSGPVPYVVERVDELPVNEEPAAYFDMQARTLFVRKDADPVEVRGYVLQLLSDAATDGGEKMPDEATLKALAQQYEAFKNLSEKETHIHVNLDNGKTSRQVKRVVRDDRGWISEVITEPGDEEVEDGE
jgi:hypothetical protein